MNPVPRRRLRGIVAFGLMAACLAPILPGDGAAPNVGNAAGAFVQPFTVTSSVLSDGAFLSTQNASSQNGCGGANISPPVQWSNAPAGTQSFAVVVYDVDGAKGLGFTHWIAYDIAASVVALPEAAGNLPSAALVEGTNSAGTNLYEGPCPPVGDQPHHYAIAVFALDLKPGTLKPGLSREAFLDAIKGHNLAETSLMVRFVR